MKHKKGLRIFIIIAGISLILGSFSLVSKIKDKFGRPFDLSEADSNENFYDDFEDEYDEDFSGDSSSAIGKLLSYKFGKYSDDNTRGVNEPYISVIYITGVISEENRTYNQKWLLRQIRRAKNDRNNRGILLYINSPGGTVYESDEAYLALMDYKKVSKRPVYAYFASLAASGGYYIACSANYIYANRNTLTGSIGVIAGQSVDATGLLEKLGIKMTTIKAGRNKNMGNYNAPFTAEQRAIMQSIADDAYAQFTEIVADSREMPIEDVRELADGRIYTARQAESNGLIDEVCSFESAKKDIEEDCGSVIFVEYKYHYEENWMSFLSGASSFIRNPESSVYELLGSSGAKCLYLYH